MKYQLIKRGIAIAALAVAFLLPTLSHAGLTIQGIEGTTTFDLRAKQDFISTPDGNTITMWGYAEEGERMQYPGPTLIVNEGEEITVNLANDLPQNVSMLFPGQDVSASGGGAIGDLTNESTGTDTDAIDDIVTYTFTASHPGTYTYYSGTNTGLQVEMGLVGALIVRPSMGANHAYNHSLTAFDHETLFLLSSLDIRVHDLIAIGEEELAEEALAEYDPVYWFINGRAAPDTLLPNNTPLLPTQPYNCIPRTTPGQKILMRIIGAGPDQHAFHYHGNHADIIARDGRLLSSDAMAGAAGPGPDLKRTRFTTPSVPGMTIDQIFTWTGRSLGWDIYDTVDNNPHTCIDRGDGFDDATFEWCDDHDKPLPVTLPELQDLAFGGFWGGSPFMGNAQGLPPGEGGLNANGGYFFMWHSHLEKEMVNFDIFPGGMMTMFVVEPPGTVIENDGE